METFIRDAIIAHMMDNNLFSSNQYGFIPGRSTVLQLLAVLDDWYRILDFGGTVEVIYTDFKKAPNDELKDTAHLQYLLFHCG